MTAVAAPGGIAPDTGPWARDERGRRLLDLTAGGGAAVLGYRPPAVVRAVARALADAPHVPHGWPSLPRDTLYRLLPKLLGRPGREALPATSGVEAVELALRLARNATGRTSFVHLSGSYHGGGVASGSICGIDGWRTAADAAGFSNLTVDLASDPELRRAADLAAQRRDIAALVIEPVWGNAGFEVPDGAAISRLAAACSASGALVVADEANTGLGRTGTWLAADLVGLSADVTVLGKSLGAGVQPIATVIVEPALAELARRPGAQPSSLAWAPPACAAALATLDEIGARALVPRARQLRAALEPCLDRLRSIPIVTRVTGAGLGFGIALRGGARSPVRMQAHSRLRELGVLVVPNMNLPGIVLMPALTIEEPLLREALGTIAGVLGDLS